MQYQQDWPKDKKITALSFFWRKTEKFRSLEHYGVALDGSTIFFVAALWAVRQWKAVDYLS